MALFDPSMFQQSSYNGAQSGGLLGYLAEALKQKAGMQPEDQPTPVIGGAGNYPVPTFGQPQQSALPPTAQPAQYQPQQVPQAPPQQPQQQPASLFGGTGGGIGDNLSAGFQGFANAKSPMQALGNLIGGLTTGARTDPAGMQQQQMMATYQALRQKGLPDADARAAALNPEILKTIAANNFDTKPKFGVIGQNQMGIPQYGFIRENQGTVTPVNGGQTAGGGTQIDPSLTGEDFLKAIAADPSLGPGKANMVKSIAEGRQPYPSGFLLKTPFGQWLTTAVGQYEPGLDATLIGQRSTFNKQMGSASPGSVGGQKTLMGTSLGHLAEVADAAAGLNNVSGFGLAPLAHLANNARALTTDQAAKINGLNETVDRFSGEVGKLYSGSAGGGVSEREQTKSRFGGAQSPQELAAALEASRELIKSKLAALENQQDQIFGPNNKARVDFLGDNGRSSLAKIDTAIAKLKSGGSPEASAAQPSQTAVNPKTGQRVMLKGGQWVPVQ